jgi:hypothetical protein
MIQSKYYIIILLFIILFVITNKKQENFYEIDCSIEPARCFSAGEQLWKNKINCSIEPARCFSAEDQLWRNKFMQTTNNISDGHDVKNMHDSTIDYNIFDKINYKRALINSIKIQKKEENFLEKLLQLFK